LLKVALNTKTKSSIFVACLTSGLNFHYSIIVFSWGKFSYSVVWGRRGRDRMVVGFATTYAIDVTDVSSNLYQGEVYNIM
jgi:hypothetical protein